MKAQTINKLISIYLVISDFVLPIPLTIFMFFLWARTVDITFATAIMLLGLVFGYTIPGIAARFLRLWEFTWPLRIKYCYYHHGFIYSGYLSLLLYVCWQPTTSPGIVTLLKPALFAFALMAFIGVHHDYFGLRTGMIVNHTKTLKENESAIKYITPAVVLSFGLIGLFYFITAYIAWVLHTILGIENILMYAVWLISGVVFMSLALLPYIIQNRKFLKSQFKKDS